MRCLLISLALLSALTFAGCGYKAGVTTGEQEAFLYFSGNTSDVTVTVDGSDPFTVESGRDNRYKVTPGKHLIRVHREGRVVIEREVYLGNGIAKEIGVN